MRKAVLLLSMGGPTDLDGVRPFLFNLFKDPAILRLPSLFRLPLAFFLSWRRTKEAKEIYKHIGGASPITRHTKSQAQALEKELSDQQDDYKVFVGMSYAPPLITQAMDEIEDFAPEEIILLPLYPQYSTTTTASSLSLAEHEIRARHSTARLKKVESFATKEGLIRAWRDHIEMAHEMMGVEKKPKILFSAHGLPMKIVEQGDPYPNQCFETANAIARVLHLKKEEWSLCYQSRVGPMRWLSPTTESEIDHAAARKQPLIIAPISFVCEHSETLYEIAHGYRRRALEKGCPAFAVARTPMAHPSFIKELAGLVVAC